MKKILFLKHPHLIMLRSTGQQSRQHECANSQIAKSERLQNFLVGIVTSFCLFSATYLGADDNGNTGTQKQELAEIMQHVNFVPELGKDEPFCKAFYEDFKKQTNIEYIQPIVKAASYDDPALKPYREQCPKFDFRKSLGVPANQDTTGWTDEDWESLGTPTYGMGHFQLYRVDMDNNPKNGEELVFYYEGEKTIKHEIPVGGSMIEKEHINPASRGYQTLNLKQCKNSVVGITTQTGCCHEMVILQSQEVG